MFTKEDFFIQDVYSPPKGEKNIFIFPRINGSENVSDFYRGLFLMASKERNWNGDESWRIYFKDEYIMSIKGRLTIYPILKWINRSSLTKSTVIKKMIIKIFSK